MTRREDLPKEFLQKLQSVTNKRAKVVIDHILERGYITTEELEKKYGYSHPPRAARDVREQGIPLETFRVKSSDGRSIAGDIDYLHSNASDYMLLCATCNRAKSWSCEHCPNWQSQSVKICAQCYWAFPQDYTHIALQEVRRTDIIWEQEEIHLYNKLKETAQEANLTIPDYVKRIIKEQFT